nr:MAG TPA: hypothetical protein [Caudoviricetes sp.]
MRRPFGSLPGGGSCNRHPGPDGRVWRALTAGFFPENREKFCGGKNAKRLSPCKRFFSDKIPQKEGR